MNEEESPYERAFSVSECIHPKDLPLRWTHENVIPAMMIVLVLFCAILLIHKYSKTATKTSTTHRAI